MILNGSSERNRFLSIDRYLGEAQRDRKDSKLIDGKRRSAMHWVVPFNFDQNSNSAYNRALFREKLVRSRGPDSPTAWPAISVEKAARSRILFVSWTKSVGPT